MLSFLSKFQHAQEMRESKDEILTGEIVRAMTRKNMPAIGFNTAGEDQRIIFKPNHSILYKVSITVDRKTGGSKISQAMFGSKAWITFQAQIKNQVADPDDLLEMYRTDAKNIFKSPMFGDVKLDHQLNSVFATKRVTVDIDKYIPQDEAGVQTLTDFLQEHINDVEEKLKPFKKG
ncbi:hypothetical protein QUF64_14995 [Anaerolineales bacterium HSG6]|nr:hypothetical protein [Anaerolineales bacterium HSG6]MDM8530153.1 hypothetical protein [Anaerolineales bacterium HSG25]